MHVPGPGDGSKWYSCTPCLPACRSVFSPLLSLVTTPHFTPSSTPSSPSCTLRIELLASHWCPSSRTLPVRAPTARTNTVSQSKITESVQDPTSSPCQIFESVQRHQQSMPNFRSSPRRHQQPVPNFRVSPMPLSQIFEPVQDHCALLRQRQIGEL
jgi:hypothetical protein